MQSHNYDELIKNQKEFFYSGKTLEIRYRINALKALKKAILANEQNIYEAIYEDFGKSNYDTYYSEIGMCLKELDYHIKKIHSWAKDKKMRTPFFLYPGKSIVKLSPYGNCLIMSPFNYPFQLTFMPLIGCLSAGNTAIIKPSEQTPNSSALIKEIINSCFPPSYVEVLLGDYTVGDSLLDYKWDFIFFTGSKRVGKIVAKKAGEHLTPIALELGGKNPAIILKDANIKITAKRLAFGKVENCGQACVAPDYLLIPEELYKPFINEFEKAVNEFFPNNNLSSMTQLLNEKAVNKCIDLLNEEDIIFGGKIDKKERKITPTLVNAGYIEEYKNFSNSNIKLMQDEIFAPILPIIRYQNIEDVVKLVNNNERPLALYIFSANKNLMKNLSNRMFYGGGCFNDCMMHVINPYLGFGGVGSSGIGRYHGKNSFECFSHRKSIYLTSTMIDIYIRYLPHSESKFKLLKKIFK